MTKLTPLEKIIAKLLMESAINKIGSYSYSELSLKLEKEYGEKVNAHYGLSRPLGNISTLCNELGLPLLSVRVQYKNDTTGRTAEGFYAIACELKPEYKNMEPKDVRKAELKMTRECSDWSPLISYLNEDNDNPNEKIEYYPLSKQIEQYAQHIIKEKGKGYIVTRNEIITFLRKKYGTTESSIIPADYCYNRWNKGLKEDNTMVFEYVDKGKYKVIGPDEPYNGLVYRNPKGKENKEQVCGYCVNGTRHIGEQAIYPDDKPDNSWEYLEGKKKTVEINTYERNPAARIACIDHYGAKCVVCGFDFGKVYGKEFDGMIHVHHLKMISESDDEYKVDPIKDLRPVCPNCHMVLHSKKEVFSIEEIKNMLNNS